MTISILLLDTFVRGCENLMRAIETVSPDANLCIVADEAQLFRHLKKGSVHHLVLLPGESGTDLALITSIRKFQRDIAVVVVAEKGDVHLVAKTVAAGATDFLVRGEGIAKRVATLMGKLSGLFNAIEGNRDLVQQNRELLLAIQARFQIIGESPLMLQLVDQVHRVAKVPRPVLILGERGTGKEMVARAIHFIGGAETRPIVTVNCAAFSDTLLESELFGHERGAFTGADATHRGKFEQAVNGTLFLDEIGNMTLPFQQKILRIVEYGTYTRVGGVRELKTNARIIAATNANLKEKMAEGTFLRDLYDRLSFEIIQVPPLHQREGDIEFLASYFLKRFAHEIPAFGGKKLSASAIAALKRYRFPGNVRELKNIIERAAYRDTTNEITPADIGLLENEPLCLEGDFHQQLDSLGRRLISDALVKVNHNQAQAARDLGLSYDQFRHYYRKFNSK